MRTAQPQPVLIDDNTYTLTAGQQQRQVKIYEKLSDMARQGVQHVVGFAFVQDLDPTFTTAPTQVGNAQAIARVVYKADGSRIACDMQGADLRAMEFYENMGRLVTPDPDLNSGTTNNFYSCRTLSMAPYGFDGGWDDWAMPSALLEAAVLEFTIGGLTDISADTTAGTVRVRTYALTLNLNSIVIAPKADLRSFTAAGNAVELAERCLIPSAVMLNSMSHDAIATGDFATFSFRDKAGDFLSAVPAAILTNTYHSAMRIGQFGLVQGEPQAATDDNLKVVNGSSPTALTAPVAAYQPIFYSPDGQRIGKVEIEVPGRLSWSGTQSTGYLLTRRILPRGADEVRELIERAFRKMKLPFKGSRIKTGDDKPYQGANAEYMPWEGMFR